MKKFWLASYLALSMVLGTGTHYAAAGVSNNTASEATAVQEKDNFLPMPQDSDVACNGAVDEAALKSALTEYVRYCNALLKEYESKDPTKVAKEVMGWETYLNPFRDGVIDDKSYRNEAFFNISGITDPLLARWIETQSYNSKVVLNADDQKIMDLLIKYGMKPVIIEGDPYLVVDVAFFRKRIKLDDPAFTEFVNVLNSQPDILYSDGGCRYSVKEMGTWAVQWEKYLKTFQNNELFFTEGRKRYLEFADFILFSDLPMTPAFEGGVLGIMESYWMEELESVAAENQGTETAKLITEYVKKVKANRNKYSAATQKEFSKKMNALFLPNNGNTSEKDTAIADSTATEAAVTETQENETVLPMPQDSDVACNGAVNEAKLKNALTDYAEYCNAVLAIIKKYESKNPTEFAKEMISWTPYYNPFRDCYFGGNQYENIVFYKIEKIVQPLLDRWGEAQSDKSKATLSAGDQKIINLLTKYGMKLIIIRDYPYLVIDPVFFRKKMKLHDPAFNAYVNILNSQPTIYYDDDVCLYSVKEKGTWAVQWEKYLKTVQNNSLFCTEGKKNYLEYINFILFSEWPNAAAFPKDNNGIMTSEWMEQLESVAAENQGTETAKLITEFLEKVKANNNKLSPETKTEISQKMNALFLPKN